MIVKILRQAMVALSVIKEWNEFKPGNGFKRLFFLITLDLSALNANFINLAIL